MSEAIIVAFKDVSFAHGNFQVLENVNLEVKEDELFCIVGPNGGGKTTLLKLILGLLTPDRGSVRIFGSSPTHVRYRIGYVPQYAQHDPQFPVTVMDVVLMGRVEERWGGPYSRQDKDAARRVLEQVDLADLSRRHFHEVSGGERQRCLIARALACKPELLVLDEPTAHMDITAETKLHEILQRLNREMTMVMVSHDLNFVSHTVEKVACVNRRLVMHPTSEIDAEAFEGTFRRLALRKVRHDKCSAE